MAVLQQFTILFLMGGTGIVLFTIASIPTVRQQLATLPPEIAAQVPPLSVLLLLQGLQYAVFLTIAIFIGIGCTRRVGLHSHLIDYWVFRTPKLVSFGDEVKWSLGIGVATTIIILTSDRVMKPLLPEALSNANRTELNWLTSLTNMLYGGITEEILMRWGLMSLLVWLGWKLLKHGITMPSRVIYQGAIVLTAVVFGLLHLPMAATIVPLTSWVIFRTILLNGIAGIAYGWLFWQYSLEAAMIGHASFHVFVFVLNILLARFI
jgi:hypothetical protein